MDTTYKFYMQQVDRDGNVTSGSKKDLEADFGGLRYCKCEGLESVGAPKNIYTEDYPEKDGPRMFHPSDKGGTVTHKETTVKLTLVFIGNTRRANKTAFDKYIENTRLYYWDTARLKKVFLVYNSETAVEEDTIKEMQYIKVAYSFTNLWGVGKKCDSEGNLAV